MNRRASTLVPNKTEQLLLSKLNRITKTSRKRTRQQHLLCVQLLPSTSHCNDGIMKLNEVSFPPDQTSTCSGEINRLCSPAACVSTAAQTLTTDRAERSSEALLTHERELTVAVRVCQGLHTDRRTKQSHQHFRWCGSLTAGQTALTAPFNLTNNSLLTEAVYFVRLNTFVIYCLLFIFACFLALYLCVHSLNPA